MLDFSQRSRQKELLDNDDIPWLDIQQNLKELNFINTYLGGHGIILSGVSKWIENKSLCIAEIGCGGGDNLHAIKKLLQQRKVKQQLIGIDIKKECIQFGQLQNPTFDWICGDYKNAHFDAKPDIIFSSLFCHHFTDDELVEQIIWMKKHSVQGFFISDLHRHPLAYYSIKFLSRLFSKSYLLKHDAPLSVARSFVKNDWKHLFEKAGIQNYTIEWKWAFRYLISYKHDQ
mgnify:FL=1|jgi:SAM-dependent methyltransferase